MSKTLIGSLFVLAGLIWGSLALDNVYNHTLGWLVAHNWVKQPPPEKIKDSLSEMLGRKPAIILYATILIIIGLFILWDRNI